MASNLTINTTPVTTTQSSITTVNTTQLSIPTSPDGGDVNIRGGDATDGGRGGDIILHPGSPGGQVICTEFTEQWSKIILKVLEMEDQLVFHIQLNMSLMGVSLVEVIKLTNKTLAENFHLRRIELLQCKADVNKLAKGSWEAELCLEVTMRDVELVDLVKDG